MRLSLINLLFVIFIIFISGCASKPDGITISVNDDSKYVETFDNLDLGVLFDFDYSLKHADERWTNVWVEAYIEGELQPEPVVQLSYGNSPSKTTEGHTGFGIINNMTDQPLFLLYGPGVKVPAHFPEKLAWPSEHEVMLTHFYAINDKKVDVELGETILLGVYRESYDTVMETYDAQDEGQLAQMIESDRLVLLLKMKVVDAEGIQVEN